MNTSATASEKARITALEAEQVRQKFQEKKAYTKGLTQESIANELGITQGVVGQWLSGITKIPDKRLIKLAQLLSFSAYTVRPRLAEYAISDHPEPAYSPVWIPIIGTAQAGPNGYWDDMGHLEHGDGFVEIPMAAPDSYALRIKGDSMAPAIRNGWVVVIEPECELVPGEFVMICTTDGLCMVKEFLYKKGSEYTFISVNQDHKPITIDAVNIDRLAPISYIVPPSKIMD